MANTWYVTGLTDPTKTTGTVTPYYFQADSPDAAKKKIGGPPLAGPFASKTAAQTWVKDNPQEFGPGKTGAKPLTPGVAPGINEPVPKISIKNPLDWLSNIGQFFSTLTQANTWLRVSKVLVGGVLVVAGLIKLTGTDQKIYGLVGTAAKKLPGV